MPHRFKLAGLHLLTSAVVAAAVALLVFGLWYPAPLDRLAGGLMLFAMLAAIDVVLGPAMTLVVASPTKPRRELQRDLLVIASLQLAGLAYGVYTLALARPVYIVFEVDRFQVVSAADFDAADLAKAPEALRHLPWTGPQPIAARRSRSNDEMLQSIEDAFSGRDLARQPGRWTRLEEAAGEVWVAARPLDTAWLARQGLLPRAEQLAAQAGVPLSQLRSLPLMGRDGEATALVSHQGARIAGTLDTAPP